MTAVNLNSESVDMDDGATIHRVVLSVGAERVYLSEDDLVRLLADASRMLRTLRTREKFVSAMTHLRRNL